MLSAPFYHSLITKSSCHSKNPVFRSSIWLLIGSGPLIHRCWLHTSKVFEDGRRRAKCSDSPSVLFVENVNRQTDSSQLFNDHRELHSNRHTHTHTHAWDSFSFEWLKTILHKHNTCIKTFYWLSHCLVLHLHPEYIKRCKSLGGSTCVRVGAVWARDTYQERLIESEREKEENRGEQNGGKKGWGHAWSERADVSQIAELAAKREEKGGWVMRLRDEVQCKDSRLSRLLPVRECFLWL